jgi:VWFA-related protein
MASPRSPVAVYGACALLLIIVVAGTVRGRARQVFRAGTTLVPIDLHAVDRDGKPVTDLGPGEFTILEDGVPQRIQHFARQELKADTRRADGGGASTALIADPSAPPPQTSRVFLIVLGRGRLTIPNAGLDGISHLLRDRLLPQDRAALLAYNRATDFTTDHASLAAVVDRYKRGHESIEVKLAMYFSGLAALYRPPGIPTDLQPEIDRLFGGATPRTMPDGAPRVDEAEAAHQRRVKEALLGGETNGDTREFDRFDDEEAAAEGVPFDTYVSAQSMDAADVRNLQTGVDYLRRFPGEKHLLYLACGGLMTPDVSTLAREASQARVAIDVIHTCGIAFGGGSMGRQVGPRVGSSATPWDAYLGRGTSIFSAQNARELSGETGGTFYANLHRWAAQDIDAMDRATRVQYTLGYYSTRAAADGRYRRIEIRVSRPGVTLMYRHGYFDTPPPRSSSPREELSYVRIVRAFEYEKAIADLALTANTRRAPNDVTGRPEIQVDVTIAPEHVTFATVDGRHVASVEVAVFLLDGADRAIDQIWQRLELNLRDETYARTMASGLTHHASFGRSDEARRVKVVVYDYAADLVGSAVAPLDKQ